MLSQRWITNHLLQLLIFSMKLSFLINKTFYFFIFIHIERM